MTPNKQDCLQGALDLLVLKTLARAPLHGYGIMTHVQNSSKGILRVEHGSLYPALYRMQQAGWIKADWRTTDTNRRARFYTLTEAGRRQLVKEEEKWATTVRGVQSVLRYA